MARVLDVSGDRERRLDSDWELAELTPGAARDPLELERCGPRWSPAKVPGTVAETRIEPPLTPASRFDADAADWWFRTRFSADGAARSSLLFDGLATLCEVWLNGAPLLATDDMFVGHRCDVTLAPENELLLRFRSLGAELGIRKGRARWRPPMVTHPELRRVRTTLFGRMPGWTPLVPPVGPWRAVRWIEHGPVRVRRATARSSLEQRAGVVLVDLEVESALPVESATLHVGARSARLEAHPTGEKSTRISGRAVLEGIERWWPHTHGTPALHDVSVEIVQGGERYAIRLGRTGFRSIERREPDGGFELSVNGEPLFCRGAVVMPFDPLRLDASDAMLEALLERARDSGMNLLRVAGNGVYPSPRFHELCDELGILIWQDFMFARLDYPMDESFLETARAEAERVLDDLELSPSLAVLCGNSEVEQTVALLGLPTELAEHPLFTAILPELVRRRRPDAAYLRSTPSGGTLPFFTDHGVCHYFGVGAYRRPLSDARLAAPRFASECLAFSHLPDDAALERWLRGAFTPALWKAGIPADNGASWDFEDVREHYLESWFGPNARVLRHSDRERWLALGRVATGEILARVLSEWRRRGSATRGAVIWHLSDWCAGAGCGLFDDRGLPKPAQRFVARALAPIAVHLSDEGLNGVRVHMTNETDRALAGELSVSLYRDGRVRTGAGKSSVALPPRSSVELSVEGLLGGFVDSSLAYRFGPPGHDLIVAALRDISTDRIVADAFHFPLGAQPVLEHDAELAATLTPERGGLELEVRAEAFVYALHVSAPNMLADDDYFNLEPGRARRVLLRPLEPNAAADAVRLSALNVAATRVTTGLRRGVARDE